ncbi:MULTISPECIES: hypothetical protein [Methanothermobacter]|jgi:hypothetical protein|uniref:Uncharacterized protein n=1 Tax=Methanothermobacter defluvii TaxID=49339 RepID=A0A371NC12_9EURY|nr:MULTISPECIES: hypothetical protein [Methanothermobacter]MBC7112252.1 hypothetical protein [Methanothermobacter sp.]MDK2875564.1 hypothetical protein [Methanothermobacter sp.]REE25185.1 hypothetical protein C7452_1534 [Methanothermobacter defluvii]WBF06360.1 hypothetical protein ISG35_09190 [Methanothermobacter thermautotrophicus]WBF08150.1 hypothetical protein ISG36_09230 [Methanothermobacter thermautotrophicus]
MSAEKIDRELKKRINQFKKLLKNEEERESFYNSICGSEILVRIEIFLPSANPERYYDGLFLYLNDEGKIVSAEYYYNEGDEGAITKLEGDSLEVVRDLFEDELSLEIE